MTVGWPGIFTVRKVSSRECVSCAKRAWSHDKKPASTAVFAEKYLPLILNIIGQRPGETNSSIAV